MSRTGFTADVDGFDLIGLESDTVTAIASALKVARGSDPRLLGLTMGWLLDRTFGERPRASRIAQALGLDQPSTRPPIEAA